MLTVSLLGTPHFVLHQQPITHLVTGRAGALLIYLALTGQPQPRTHLVELLWENQSEQQAKANLRYRLSDLRKVVGDYIVATGETVAFNQELPHWVDVTVFTTYMTTVAAPTPSMIEPTILEELLKFYRGEFLTGFLIENAPVFERWLHLQRRHLHDLLVQGLHLRAEQHLAEGDYAAGLMRNHDLLTLEPWREEAHQQRMLLLAHSDQRNAALQQYTRCCQVLREELDVPPMLQTTALYEAIKAGQWVAAHQANGYSHTLPAAIAALPTAAWRAGATVATAVTGAPPPAPVEMASPFDLGAMPDSAHFYGRQAELVTLHSWVGQERSQLIALVGLGGQGKTALAAAFLQDVIADAQNPAHGFTHVIWRSLHHAPPCRETLQGWLHALGIDRGETQPSSVDELITQLFALLQSRRCLLVLDGVEALFSSTVEDEPTAAMHDTDDADYATLFRLFFQRRHRSCLLLTSRVRPALLTQLDERNRAFHLLHVDGLTASDSVSLLNAHGIRDAAVIHQHLYQRYVGNPLLLTQAANLIHELFGGDGAAFAKENLYFGGDIDAVLVQQIALLSPLEQQILYHLAQAAHPLDHQTLWAQLTPLPAKRAYFYALQRLQRTFFLQMSETQITVAPLFAAYLA
jgi:DNA-binding SARP family transcriptional activator